ncbi:MAG: hypothetical protein QF464_22690, partial [Myxococcota bacterium]|nr:hypothetical protein [Myxococcota bacterium]
MKIVTLFVACACAIVMMAPGAFAQESGLVEYYCPEPIDAWESGSSYTCKSGWVLDRTEEASCDAEMCCLYSGPVKYDVRHNEDVDLEWPVGEGRCVKGEPNGTWKAQYFDEIETDEEDYEYVLKYVATGRYNKGLPVGGHVVTHGSLVVEAACYERIRERYDGETTYSTEVVWAFDQKDELPEKPEKPVLEDFMEMEKPEMEEVEKPDRGDYDSGADFR